ncbi:hypothetical protein SVAN01_05121 [Stagonosporopsis vannaccii]|nr:hypothetical protein SVAN01_05121 [Stagonosporopsis vannaccii]
MMPGNLSDVPTLACLNKPQKRALILRDQLRSLEPAHLDTFLDGISTDEPPTYKGINGAVYPAFAQVTIKEEATRFDLGNVQFPEEGGATYRAYLTVEDERFEMRTEDALPRDDADLGSIAIHRFVAENMFPLFKTKYKAIHARMEKINEARRVAYNMLDHPPAKFEDGETLSRLTARPRSTDESPRDGGSRKRREITKHISNKRQRVGLEAIPDNVKSETFNTIPTQIKVDLFNNIIKTALPNFDNLITASWNVVSVYSNVGSDFPELHKAVVELKGALEEFENAYAPRSKGGRSRKEATSSQQSGGGISRTATPSREGRDTATPGARANVATVDQRHDDNLSAGAPHHEGVDEEEIKAETRRTPQQQDQYHMPPPPRLAPKIQHQPISQDEHVPAAPPPLQQISRHTPETCARYTPEKSPRYTPERPLRNNTSCTPPVDRCPSSPTSSSRFPHPLAPGSELMRKRMEYTASLEREKMGLKTQEKGGGEEGGGYEKAGECEQEKEKGLGSSVLGRKKRGLMVPVADMLGRVEGGGGRRGC